MVDKLSRGNRRKFHIHTSIFWFSVIFILSSPSMHAWGLVLCGVRRETGMGCDQMGVCVRVWNIGVETGIIGKRGGHAHEMSVKHGHG